MKKLNEKKDKEIVFVLGIGSGEASGHSYDFGLFATVKDAVKSIEKRGLPNDEYRIFKCKFIESYMIETKIKKKED